MITKKEWDAMPLKTKEVVLSVIYGDDFLAHYVSKELLYEYRHNFDFNDTGKALKKVLQQCYKVADGNIYVKVDIKYNPTASPKFLPTPEIEKKKKAQFPTNKTAPIERKKWRCDYTPTYDHEDLCHVWCYANSQEEARDYFLSEWHDIYEIIQIVPIK